MPIEGWKPEEIVSTFGPYDGLPSGYPAQMPEGKRKRIRPLGMHSDDTQQALALLSVCCAGWSPAAWGKCLAQGAALKAWRGTGRHFDAAVEKLQKGKAPETTGSPSAGIGAAMRIAVLGAFYAGQSRRLSEVAMESSAITHADLRSCALGYAVAFAAERLVSGARASVVRSELPDAVAEVEDEWLSARAKWEVDRTGRHQLSLGLARVLSPSMATEPSSLGAQVMEAAKPYLLPSFPASHPNHGFALLGGVYGLSVALLESVEPNAALLAIMRQGEDTDTVAAIAGGVLGARFGSAWVPKEKLTDRAHLELYAQAVVSKQLPEPLAALLQREALFTAQEKMFQA